LTEACIDLAENWLGLTRIELDVFVDNAPAIALYESCGFRVEGTARNFCLRDGALVDAHYMARLKP
jgi:putative acetyltransferase